MGVAGNESGFTYEVCCLHVSRPILLVHFWVPDVLEAPMSAPSRVGRGLESFWRAENTSRAFKLRILIILAILDFVPETGNDKIDSGDPSPKDTGRKFAPLVNWSASGLVFEVGYTIAIPLVLFAAGGRYLDKMFNTSPWLLLFGIIISIFVSSFLVYRKVSKML